MLLPGRWVLNTCDCGITRLSEELLDERRQEIAELPALAALTTRDAAASWLLREEVGLPCSVAGLEASRSLPEPEVPARWGLMRSLGVIAWRTGWGDADHAVWIRVSGGLPSHTHADTAHVSLFRKGLPVLIEAGTPTYGHPDIGRSFGSGAGHNILQLGLEWPGPYMEERSVRGWLKRDTPLEIRLMRVGEQGGQVDLEIDPSGYEGLASWARSVSWDAEARLAVKDSVHTTTATHVLFRWHLGSAEPARVERGGAGVTTVTQGRTTVRLAADQELVVECTEWPGPDETSGAHRCLVVRTARAVTALTLTTEVE